MSTEDDAPRDDAKMDDAAMDEIVTLLTCSTGPKKGWAQQSLHPYINRIYASLGADPVDWDAFCRALTRTGVELYFFPETGWAACRCEPRDITAHARLRLSRLVPRPEKSRKPHYHITPLCNVYAILTKGLKPQLDNRKFTFTKTQEVVSLFPTPRSLEKALDSWIRDEFAEDAPIALLEVVVPLSIKIEFDFSLEIETCVYEPIPASNIRLLSRDLLGEPDLAWLSVRQAYPPRGAPA